MIDNNNIQLLIDDLSKSNIQVEGVPLHTIIKQFIQEAKITDIDQLMYILSMQVDIALINQKTIFLHLTEYFLISNNFYSAPKFTTTPITKKNIKLVSDYLYNEKSLLYNEQISLYWAASAHSFRENIHINKDIREMYTYLLEKTKTAFNLNLQNENSDKRVFIFLNQYVSELHAPTKIANIWSEQFTQFGYEVIIIVSTPKPFKFPYSNHPSMIFNKLYKTGEIYSFNDQVALVDVGYCPNQAYVDFLENINIAHSDIFLSVGDSNLHFDLLPTTKKYNIPTAVQKHTILTNAQYLLYNDDTIKLDNIEGKKVEIHKISSDFTNVDIEFKIKTITLEDTINLVVVGNRLDSDIDLNFWSAIEDINTKIDSIRLYIIGEYNINDIPLTLRDSVTLLGFQKDLAKAMAPIHFFINPDRKGGGQSALYALKLGIPIITLPHCDVHTNLLKKYHINSLNEISSFIYDYIIDTQFKASIDKQNQELYEYYAKNKKEMHNFIQTLIDSKQSIQ